MTIDIAAKTEHHHSNVDKYIGDAIMALFGAKKASEDDAERAVRAALGMLDRMEQINELLAPKNIELGVRIGINTGLVVAGELGSEKKRDFTVMGDTVNTASRLESAAEVNTILVSKNTRLQAGDIFKYKALKPIKFRGKSKTLKAYRVLGVLMERTERWERESEVKSEKYIGRSSEWKQLESYLNQYYSSAPRKCKVPVIGLRGDGGIGKSRMVYEFLCNGPCQPGVLIKGKAISYTSAPYRVFVSMMKNMLGLLSGGEPVQVVKALWQNFLGQLKEFARVPEDERRAKAASLDECEDYLAYLLGISRDEERIKSLEPDKLKAMIFDSFRRFFEALAALPDQGEVLYLVFDDLHWIDEMSSELIDYLMEKLDPVRQIIIITMFRPDYQQSAGWREGENYFELKVNPLSPEETVVMVEGMLRGLVLTEKLKNLIYDKSVGNPFYIEEIAFALIDKGVLVPDDDIQPGNRIWVVNPAISDVELPDSIHGMVQTRIDKLDPGARTLLFEASVIGMEFTVGLLSRLHVKAGGQAEDISAERLGILERARMIKPKAAEYTGQDGSYVFSNVLVTEVCYNTLLNYNKEVLHNLLGECIEESHPEGKIPEDEYHRLAYHFRKGGNTDKAIGYLETSADIYAGSFSNRTAIKSYTRLLEILNGSGRPKEETDKLRVRNLFKQAEIEYRVGSLEDAYDHYAECGKAYSADNDFKLLCNVLTRAGEIDRIRERPEKAMMFFEKSLKIAEKIGDDASVADNLANIGILLEESGDYNGAMEYIRKALKRAATEEQRLNISHYVFQRT
ncbi:MAG: adenylate/guanylate cyclase domain-containing protein [Gemmatimonadota bacterium]|nr:adenylate/guanylate cyclase domain-containing protein [Gemmatimonadota bacterium]